MKKGILLCFSLVFLGGGCLFNFNQEKQSVDKINPLPLGIQEKAIKEETDTTIISIVYPEFTHTELSRLAKEVVLEERRVFEESLDDEFALPDWAEDIKNGFWAEYTIDRFGENIISLVYTLSAYHAGAAHPNTYLAAFTYDVATNKQLAFEDVFKTDKVSLQVLSDKIQEELKKQFREYAIDNGADEEGLFEDGWIEDGAGPDPKNFNIFILQADSVTFLFPPYQVGPYSEGTKEVIFPLNQLQDLVILEM